MNRSLVLFALALSALLSACDDDPCGRDAIQRRLDAALPGDVVQIGACRVDGRLGVPAGVILEGSGIDATTLVGGLDLVPGTAGPTTARALRVESASGVAVRISGAGGFALSELEVVIERGVGIGAMDVTSGSLSSVSIRGGVDAAAGVTLAPGAGPDVGSFGLVLLRAGSAAERIEVVDLEMGDAGPWGTILDSSAVRWTGGELHTITGVAVQVTDSDVELADVHVDGLVQGLQLLPAYGVAFVGGTAHAEGLVVEDGEGVGVLVHASDVTLISPIVRTQRLGGVFAQGGAQVAIEDGTLEGNGLAAIALVDVERASVSDTDVSGTELRRSILGETTPVEIGDGIHVSLPRGDVRLERTRCAGNARAGLLIDVADAASLSRVSLVGVTADADGGALGAIAQQGGALVASGGWDADVTRAGAAAVNDAALAAPLDVGSAIVALPRPDVDRVVD